jgi:hypothetical protein
MLRLANLLVVVCIGFSVPSWADDDLDVSEDLNESFESLHPPESPHQKEEDQTEGKVEVEKTADVIKTGPSKNPSPMSGGTIYAKATDKEKKSYEEYRKTGVELINSLQESLQNTEPDQLDLSKFEDRFKKMAELYVGMHYKQRDPGRENMKFTGLLGPLYEEIRRLERDLKRNVKKGIPESVNAGGGPLERAWEAALTRALDEKAKNVTPVEFSQGLLAIQKDWQAGEAHGLSVASTQAGWQFTGEALRSVGLLSNISILQKNGQAIPLEMKEQAKKDLARFVDGKFFAKRTEEGKPEIAKELSMSPNQVLKWGKIYSIDTLNLLEKNSSLRDLLPEKFQDEKVIAEYKRAFQESLAKNLEVALPNESAETDSRGSSDNHTAMVFASLAALPADLRDPLAKKFLKLIEEPKPQTSTDQFGRTFQTPRPPAGGSTHLLQYAPWRQLPINESERSSAGRYVPYALVKYQTEPTEANREILIKSLENFHLYSGSLRSEVPRGGVHAGADHLAPYYYHPALDAAGKAMTVLAETLPTDSTQAAKSRLSTLRGNLERSALSTYDPTTKIHLSPGEGTYQGVGPVWTAAHSSAALLAMHNTRTVFEEPATKGIELADSKPDSPKAKKPGKETAAWDVVAWAKGMRNAASRWMGDAKGSEGKIAPPEPLAEKAPPTPAERILEALGGDFTPEKAQAIDKLLESDPSLLVSVEKQLNLDEKDARAIYLKSLRLRKGIESPEQLKMAQQIRDAKGESPFEKAARDLASRELSSALTRHQDWVSLLTSQNRFQATPESSLAHLLTVQQGLGSEDPAARAAALARVAQTVFSMNPEARAEMKTRVAEIAKAKSGDFSEVMNHAYGGPSTLPEQNKKQIDQALEAARVRAEQWNASLQKVVGADGSINLDSQVTLLDTKGVSKQVSGKEWLAAQKEMFGEDRLLKWSAQVGGETGKRTMAGVLDGSREIAFNDGNGWGKLELTQGKEGQQIEGVLSSLTRRDRLVELKTDTKAVKARYAWDENASKLLPLESADPVDSKGGMGDAMRGLAESLKKQAEEKAAQAEKMRAAAKLAELGAESLDSASGWFNGKMQQWREAKRGPASEKQGKDVAPPLPEEGGVSKSLSFSEGIGKVMNHDAAERFAAQHLTQAKGWEGKCSGNECVYEYKGTDLKWIGQKIRKTPSENGFSFRELKEPLPEPEPEKHSQKPPTPKEPPQNPPSDGKETPERARKRLVNADQVILSGRDCGPCRQELGSMGFQFSSDYRVTNDDSLRAKGWAIETVPGAGTIYRKAPKDGPSVEVRLKPNYGASVKDDRFDSDKALMAMGYEEVWKDRIENGSRVRSRIGFRMPGSDRIEGGGYPLLLHKK